MKLTDEQIRIKVAELQGWRWTPYNGRIVLFPASLWDKCPLADVVNPDDYPELEHATVATPNYPTSRDAIIEAVMGLDEGKRLLFGEHLSRVIGFHPSRELDGSDLCDFATATPRQLCVAFLRTHGEGVE